MNDPGSSTFELVRRGYEPAQVNRRLEELTAAVAQANAQRDALAARLEAAQEAAERDRPEPAPAVVEPATFENLGARVGQILTLANDEADELRRTAYAEVSEARQQLEEETKRVREDADRYAADTRSTAETEATRIVEDARRAADERLDNAERDAAARIQEAEAIYEEQRAKAVQSAADFETTLAERRKVAEEEFQRQMEQVERRLDEATQTLETARTEAQQTEAAAKVEAGNLVRAAEEQATSIVDDARTRATRMRAESDRELSAATQRRDAINAQLANVRQMLATLTGSVTAPDPFAADERAATQTGDQDGGEPVADDAAPEVDAEPAEEASPVEAR
ncbi:DNA repair exonuclease SbcCD ATPase subunit [Marmoricola sp. URHA0025 HA25]